MVIGQYIISTLALATEKRKKIEERRRRKEGKRRWGRKGEMERIKGNNSLVWSNHSLLQVIWYGICPPSSLDVDDAIISQLGSDTVVLFGKQCE